MRSRNTGIFILLVAIVVITVSWNGKFADPSNIRALIRDTSLYGLISLGVAFVIITGGIDLSIGSLIALSGVVFITTANIEKYEVDFRAPIASVSSEGEGILVAFQAGLPKVLPGDQLQTEQQTWVIREIVSDATNQYLRLNESGRPPQAGEMAFLSRSGEPLRHVITVHRSPWLCSVVVLVMSALIGLLHGVLVTWGRLQPFIVTLCGLLIYRGLARILSGDTAKGFGDSMHGFRQFVGGAIGSFPVPFVGRIAGVDASWISWIEFPWAGVLLAIVALLGWVFLYRSVFGRHLLALGQNEQAALYSGINTGRLTILAYVLCSSLAGLAGILFLVDWTTMAPSTAGSFYELYAIAAAVLGGCSLRGGQGALVGVIAGAAVMRCLYKSIDLVGIGKEWEFVVIGLALFAGVVFDEVVRRFASHGTYLKQ